MTPRTAHGVTPGRRQLYLYAAQGPYLWPAWMTRHFTNLAFRGAQHHHQCSAKLFSWFAPSPVWVLGRAVVPLLAAAVLKNIARAAMGAAKPRGAGQGQTPDRAAAQGGRRESGTDMI